MRKAHSDGPLNGSTRVMFIRFQLVCLLSLTPLHCAVRGEHFEVIEFLLSVGADVNARDEAKIGETPLGEVAGTCSYELAEVLIAAGAIALVVAAVIGLPFRERRRRGDEPSGD